MSNLILNIPQDADVSIVAEQDLGVTVNIKKDEVGKKTVEAVVSKESENTILIKEDGLFSGVNLVPVQDIVPEEGYDVIREDQTYELVINGQPTGIKMTGFTTKLVARPLRLNLQANVSKTPEGNLYVVYNADSSWGNFTTEMLINALGAKFPALQNVTQQYLDAGTVSGNVGNTVVLQLPSNLDDAGLELSSSNRTHSSRIARLGAVGTTPQGGEISVELVVNAESSITSVGGSSAPVKPTVVETATTSAIRRR